MEEGGRRRGGEGYWRGADSCDRWSCEYLRGKLHDPGFLVRIRGQQPQHYVTTPEEYAVQRYEGASTLFGQHELAAYINLTVSNAAYLTSDSISSPDPGPSPPDNRDDALSFIPPVVQDNPPAGQAFGQCIKQPESGSVGSVVRATFVGANPRNDLRLEGTFAAVEKRGDDGTWRQVRSDADWFLTYTWTRKDFLTGTSEVVLEWDSGEDGEGGGVVEKGEYRFRYYGDSRNLIGVVRAFSGVSDAFTLE